MNIINMTPHQVTLVGAKGKKVVLESEGVVRVREETREIGTIEVEGEEITLIRKELSDIDDSDLKKVKEILQRGDAVLVSLLTAKALKKHLSEEEQKRVLIIGRTLRDESGRIIGADALSPISEV